MQICVVGTGRMGTGLMKVLATAYNNLLWVGRKPEQVPNLIRALGLTGRVTSATADQMYQADMIILAMWQRDLPAFVEQHRAGLAGKILVHIANPFNEAFTDYTTPWDTSAAELFQQMIPEARVAGAFKNTFWVIFDHPEFPEGLSDNYVTADDETVRATVIEALRPLPFRVLDAGSLQNNRVIERMTLFSRELAQRYGHYPRVTWRLLGQLKERADIR